MRRQSAERGSATIWVVTAIAVVMVAMAAAAALGAATLARQRAALAADAAALAAAASALEGSAAACTVAAHIGTANGARVVSCTLDGAFAEVVAAVALPWPLGKLGTLGPALGRARAGP